MLNLNNYINKTNTHRPLVFNSILWSMAFVILLFIFSKGKAPIAIDYIYTIGFLVFMIVPVSINFYMLIPKLLKRERYVVYGITFIINLIVFAIINQWLFEPLLNVLFSDYFFISYLSNTNILIIFSIFLVSTTLIKLAEDWFYFNKTQNKILRLQNQHIQTQLSSLRSQINPHFLFNSLNVIYALALEKKDTTKEAIVQLSDILRYVIYDTDTERVTLKQEIALLKNYSSFQNHKLHQKDLVKYDIDVENDQYKIYPMLLLPLLENSYKHGVISGANNDFITLSIQQKRDAFTFEIANPNHKNSAAIDDGYSGVGLDNIRKNLNLVYPDQHQLNVEESDTEFKVILEIKNG